MGKQWKQWQSLFSWSLMVTTDHCWWWLSHEIKTLAPWKKSYDQPKQHIKKQRQYIANKCPSSQSCGFPVVMYGCESWTINKAEHQIIDAFEPWCWRRLLRVLWTARRSNQCILKEISSEENRLYILMFGDWDFAQGGFVKLSNCWWTCIQL